MRFRLLLVLSATLVTTVTYGQSPGNFWVCQYEQRDLTLHGMSLPTDRSKILITSVFQGRAIPADDELAYYRKAIREWGDKNYPQGENGYTDEQDQSATCWGPLARDEAEGIRARAHEQPFGRHETMQYVEFTPAPIMPASNGTTVNLRDQPNNPSNAASSAAPPSGNRYITPTTRACVRTEYLNGSLFMINGCNVAVTNEFTSDSGNTWGQGDLAAGQRSQATMMGMGYNPNTDGTVYNFSCPQGDQPVMPNHSAWIPHNYKGPFLCHVP
jgi:hypothetical protein